MRTLNEIYDEGKKALEGKNLLNWCEAGAGTRATISENERSFKDLFIAFRTLHEKFEADISTTILGMKSSAPFFSASMGGFSKIINGGEDHVVKASSEFGVPVFLWDGIPDDIEKYVQKSSTPIFWVLKPLTDLNKMEVLISKAEEAGVLAIGIDIDVLYGGQSGDKHTELKTIGPARSDYYEKVRGMTSLPMFLKGILHPVDALSAVESGYDAIVVSNHGGRVLDYSCPPLYVLPKIREVIGDRAEIYIDSGFRTALDVYKGLAMGADAVLLGRPILYGLAAGGCEAVRDIFDNLAVELKRIMGLTNSRSVSEIVPDTIIHRPLVK